MQIPITKYEITYRDMIEVTFGSLTIIFGLIGSIIIANIITKFISQKPKNKENFNIIFSILCIHIIIILLFIMLIKYISKQFIKNSLILESINSFNGPVIGLSSFYFIQNLKSLVILVTNIIT
jgi:hypothetical protein